LNYCFLKIFVYVIAPVATASPAALGCFSSPLLLLFSSLRLLLVSVAAAFPAALGQLPLPLLLRSLPP